MQGLFHHSKIIHQKLGDDLYLSEILFFPEICQLGKKEKNVLSLRKLLQGMITRYTTLNLYQKQLPNDVSIDTFKIDLKAPKYSLENDKDFEVTLSGLTWNVKGSGRIAYLPGLGIQVVTNDREKDFNDVIEKEIVHALRRMRAAASFKMLEQLSRVKEIEVEENEIFLNVKSPVEQVYDNDEKKESVLKKDCTDLDFVGIRKNFHCETDVKMLADLLNSSKSPSLILVGPAGVGKTAIFHEMVKRKQFYGLTGRRFYGTSGSRLVAGMTGFGQWQERCLKIINELQSCRGILHCGNAVELLDAGKSANSDQGIASFLETYVNRGDLTCVTECTPEEYALIEKRQPGFLETFYKVTIKEPEEERLKLILRDVIRVELNTGREYKEAITTAISLMKRYSPYTAFPGKALRLLTPIISKTRKNEKGKRFFNSADVYRHFSTQTGLPSFLIDDERKMNFGECETFFKDRVAGQEPAVETVVNTLLAVKASLIRPQKPIASLLCIGPTGVGKTEMAKTLAEYLFNNKDRIIRFDMSEFATPAAIMSLTGFGSRQEGLLTSKVRNQPFSVILFDELEKAGPQFFDLLLQILGEGRLTDHKGRTADFCSSVIIMTSNLGAASFQTGSVGFQESGRSYEDAVEHFSSAVRKFFRPEIYNRIDRIVPFMPLELEVIKKICYKELKKIQNREGLRYRKVQLELTDTLIEHLAKEGCDPLFGARPLKRTLEQQLVSPLSQELNAYSQEVSLHIGADLEGSDITFSITNRDKQKVPEKKKDDATVIYSLIELRRRLALLGKSSHQRILNNKISELKYHIYSAENVKERTQYQVEQHRYISLRDDRELVHDELVILEEETLTDFYKGRKLLLEELERKSQDWEKKIREIFTRFYCSTFDITDEIGIFVKAQDKSDMNYMLNAYLQVAGEGSTVKLHKVTIHEPPLIEKDEITGKETVIPFETEDIPAALDTIRKGELWSLDYFLIIKAPNILPILHRESGMHSFMKDSPSHAWVRVMEADIENFVPPEDLSSYNERKRDTKRRVVDLKNDLIKDLIARKNAKSHGKIAATIAEIIISLFEFEAWYLLEEYQPYQDKLEEAKRQLSLD